MFEFVSRYEERDKKYFRKIEKSQNLHSFLFENRGDFREILSKFKWFIEFLYVGFSSFFKRRPM